jgi:hypothetical protein
MRRWLTVPFGIYAYVYSTAAQPEMSRQKLDPMSVMSYENSKNVTT